MKMPFLRSSDPEISVTITVKTFLKVLLLVVVTIVLLAALKKAAYAITLVFIAFFLALALNAPVSWIAKHLPGSLKGSRPSATSLSFLIVVIILGAILYSLIPPIVHQTESFINNAPHLVQDIRSKNSTVSRLINQYHLQGQIDSFSKGLVSRIQRSSGTAVTALTGIATSVFATITILVLAFMMLIEAPKWLNITRQLLPENHRDHANRLMEDMYKAVRGYVNGQVLLAAFASLVILPGLLIFHVSYPIALMLIIFICALIPVIGHTIAIIIVTLVALFHSPLSGLGIFVYYLLYQQIEAYFIQPRLQSTTTKLSPLLVFLSLIIGVNFGGLIGGLVAIPIMACIRVIVLDFLDNRHIVIKKEPALAHTEDKQ
ncbi:MAG: AI-2E family transporter [Candidatus Saccharimonadales bacterium]